MEGDALQHQQGGGDGQTDPHPAGGEQQITEAVAPGAHQFNLLLERAVAEGATAIEGIEMLIEQGALSFLLWTGIDPPRTVMREAAYEALERAVPA